MNLTEFTVTIGPTFNQLKLLLIIALILFVAWCASLYFHRRSQSDTCDWCNDWNKRAKSEWICNEEYLCVVIEEEK